MNYKNKINKETKSKNIIYFVVVLVFAYMDKPSEPNNFSRDTVDEKDCARMYPPVESEDVISDNAAYFTNYPLNPIFPKHSYTSKSIYEYSSVS